MISNSVIVARQINTQVVKDIKANKKWTYTNKLTMADTFEEAEAFIASQNCPDDFWVSSDDEPDDCYDECGFDPYEGCYTYDC